LKRFLKCRVGLLQAGRLWCTPCVLLLISGGLLIGSNNILSSLFYRLPVLVQAPGAILLLHVALSLSLNCLYVNKQQTILVIK
jgi:hypothetical protein